MKAYIVIYEFTKTVDNYSDFHTAINTFEKCKRLTRSSYLINTNSNASLIRENLKRYIYPDDKLFIAGLNGEFALVGFHSENIMEQKVN